MFLTGLQLVCPGCCPEKFFSRTVAWRAKETVLARKGGDSGQKNETIFFGGARSRQKKIIIIYFALISYKNMEAWALCVLWALPWGLLPPVRALGGGADAQGLDQSLLPNCLEGSPCPDAALEGRDNRRRSCADSQARAGSQEGSILWKGETSPRSFPWLREAKAGVTQMTKLRPVL